MSAYHVGHIIYAILLLQQSPALSRRKGKHQNGCLASEPCNTQLAKNVIRQLCRWVNANLVASICAVSKGPVKGRPPVVFFFYRLELFVETRQSPTPTLWSFSVQRTWPLSLELRVGGLEAVCKAQVLLKFRNKQFSC